MNDRCARCAKTVYPTEKVKCLDSTWHKFCFKCDTCGMTLNMKNYKGYDKRPYCNTHYPTTKFTAVADTPESRRIAENTKIQSNIAYHADFEKQKGKMTSVVDDPETQRIRKNTAIQSNLQYQNVVQKKYEMEAKRPEQVMDGPRGRSNPGKISDYEPHVSPQPPPGQYQSSQRKSRDSREMSYNAPPPAATQAAVVYDSSRGDVQNGQRRHQPGSISDYDPMAGFGQNAYSPAPPQPTYQGGYGQQHQPQHQPPPQQQPQRHSATPSYRAVYDYTAADDDEVTFSEGDVIVNCEIVDAGWMTGTVRRTGQHGMLPSNYVEAL